MKRPYRRGVGGVEVESSHGARVGTSRDQQEWRVIHPTGTPGLPVGGKLLIMAPLAAQNKRIQTFHSKGEQQQRARSNQDGTTGRKDGISSELQKGSIQGGTQHQYQIERGGSILVATRLLRRNTE